MRVNQLLLNINSEMAEALTTFYRDVVALEQEPNMGESAFQLGGAVLIIDGHSEVAGPTKEPQRVLINFMVDDLASEEARLKGLGVPFIRSAGREPWGGVISTFLDPDGNYCQLIEYKPE